MEEKRQVSFSSSSLGTRQLLLLRIHPVSARDPYVERKTDGDVQINRKM